VRHPKVSRNILLGVSAFLCTYNSHRTPAETGNTANNRAVVSKFPITVKLNELIENEVDVLQGCRAFGMTRNHYALPGREILEYLFAESVSFPLEDSYLIREVNSLFQAELLEVFYPFF
jgi:hypothetical protein